MKGNDQIPVRCVLCLWLGIGGIVPHAHGGQGTSHFIADAAGQGSSPANLLVIGDSLYFSADDGIYGKELWRLDAEGRLELVGDFYPGPEGSKPRNLVALGDRVCFVGLRFDPARQKVLEFIWSTAGTAADVACHRSPRNGPSVEGDLCVIPTGNGLYGAVTQSAFGRELIRFETETVTDTVPGATGGIVKEQEYFAVLNNRLMFTVQPATASSRELWVYDHSSPGQEAAPLLPTQETDIAFPMHCKAVDGMLWFAGSDGMHGIELCATDGTKEGTAFVKDINPGTGDSMPKEFAAHQGVVYFQANDGAHGIELWRTDGAEQGTWLLKDINPGPRSSSPYFMRSIGPYLLFAATHDDTGTELWRTDGTEQGTQLVKDIYSGTASSDLYQPTPYKGLLLFAANHPEFGEELWRSDGTSEGTGLVKDISPGPAKSEPYHLTAFRDCVYFSANDGLNGEELWSSDGTQEGTLLAADIRPQTRIVRSSNPTNLTAAPGGVFFAADDLETGNELWWSGADSLDTHCVANIRPGPEPSGPEDLLMFSGLLFFTADDGVHGRELWRSDGAGDGTVLVADIAKGPETSDIRQVLLSETGLLFAVSLGAGDAVYGLTTPDAPPAPLLDLASLGLMGRIVNIRRDGERLYVCVRGEGGGARFVLFDLAQAHAEVTPYSFPEAATWEAVCMQAVAGGQTGSLLQCYFSLPGMTRRHTHFQERWFFAARTVEHGVELWSAKDDVDSAYLVRDCFPGPASGSPGDFTTVDGRLFFTASDPAKGRELWLWDHTTEDTYVVHDWTGQTARGAGPQYLTEHGGALFYGAPGPTPWYEERRMLTKCEYTANGLMVVPAAEPGRHWPDKPLDLTSVGPWLYFSADHPATGRELWRYTEREVGARKHTVYEMVYNIGSEPAYDADVQVLDQAWH